MPLERVILSPIRAASAPHEPSSICSHDATARTLIFFLLSGGGSPLVEMPLDPNISLEDLQELHRLLVTCGAPIQRDQRGAQTSIGSERRAPGGARRRASTKLTLGITDVPAGCESALGSGPTLPDPTTVADACRVIEQYDLYSKLPASIQAKFANPGSIPETPKAGDPSFATVSIFTAARHARSLSPRPSGRRSPRLFHAVRQFHRRSAHRSTPRIICWSNSPL